MSDELSEEAEEKLLALWRDLGSPESSVLPADQLAAAGITQEEYALWRMGLADREQITRDVLARLRGDEDQLAEMRKRGEEPPNRLTPEERDAIERAKLDVELQARRARELEGQASWEPDEDAG